MDLDREQLILLGCIGLVLVMVGMSLGRMAAGERGEQRILLVPSLELRGIPLDTTGLER